MKKIQRVIRRSGSLVATCEICGKRGGPHHVPWQVDYEDKPGEGRSGKRAYRCEQHRPIN